MTWGRRHEWLQNVYRAELGETKRNSTRELMDVVITVQLRALSTFLGSPKRGGARVLDAFVSSSGKRV